MIQHQQWYGIDRLLVVDEINHASVQLNIFKKGRLKESYKADCLLWALWVDEASRKQGVAKRLIKAMEKYAVLYHCKSIALEYDRRDTPEWVLHWYERLGYEEKAFGNHSSLLVKQLMK